MKSRFAALLLAAIMTLSLVACGQQPAENTASTSEPETIVEQPSIPEGVLAIAEQGMFSAGGTVLTSEGTFDVSNYYTSREGSTTKEVVFSSTANTNCFLYKSQRAIICSSFLTIRPPPPPKYYSYLQLSY